MSIVFIVLGALAGTLFLISRLGLDLPPAEVSALITGEQISNSREDLPLAA